MKTKLLDLIVCPECKRRLSLVIIEEKDNEIKEGALKCPCSKEYKITNFIPRFVDNDKYVDSFSFEWQVHSKTQLDSANTDHISEDTFQARIDFSLEDLKEKLVLDAGCGCGRFSEVAAKYGATVVGFDLSFAVDVAFKNIGLKPNVHLIQADIYHLPFHPNTFDLIFSFGVLHHTPDCKRAFKQLPQFLKSKGRISLFVYSSYNKGIVYSSNFWRLLTVRLPKRLLYALSYISVPLYYIYKIPVLGSILKMFFVISMYPDARWRVLDTFDWYSPRYQSKHTHAEVNRWFDEEGLRDIKIYEGEVTMSGVKS